MDVTRHTILDSNDWKISCEISPEAPHMAIIHCDVYEWSHTLYKEYLDTWEDILEGMKTKGLTELGMVAQADDMLLIRFAVMFGFNPSYDVDINGVECIFMNLELK